ncbi:MAG: hypothetical protein QOF19_490 [Alphaproteobacteria bacterium]|jgi:SAM-dependent methyltransferase|nr:hypothetical protein [Alphaproteobacteria bacterium]
MTPNYREFSDPRLVALYDSLNASVADREFYCRLAERLSASIIIDLGCGTGLLTYELAKRGYRMVGVEPSSAMLAVARRKPHGEQVQWVEGSTRQLEELRGDLVLMTSHVAQFFIVDEGWKALLEAAHKALIPGGHIVFDSRNPFVRPWEKWHRETSSRKVNTPSGKVEMWYQLTEVKDSRVLYEIHYLFADTGEELVSVNELRYRSQDDIAKSLTNAGFSVENIYGDWDGRPADPTTTEMIFVAARK